MNMERTRFQTGDNITPDRIIVKAWGYDIRVFKNPSFALSFDGDTIYCGYGVCHPPIHEKYPDKEFLDMRYYMKENLVSVWTDHPGPVMPVLISFRETYDAMPRKPFPPSAKFILVSDGWIVMCDLDELDSLNSIDDNSYLRDLHLQSPVVKQMMRDREWKDGYWKEGRSAWVERHGELDPAEYHLLAYEE